MAANISIIMPLYNASTYVAEAIQSIINQTYTNWELIIVNDGSTDNSLEVAQNFESDKIKVYTQNNKGQCAANNFGYSKSTGKYIKFFDADDIISANMLEEQLKLIEGSENLVASAQWGRFYKDDMATFKLNPEVCWQDMKPLEWICSSWRNAQPMMQCALWLIPRKVLEKSGLWDERLSLINDFDFFTRVILATAEVRFCSTATLYYRSGLQNALSGQKSRKAVESAFLSLMLGTQKLLSIQSNDLTKICCANMWQGFVYEFYFKFPDLAKQAEKNIAALGGSDYKMPSGSVTNLVSKFIGWKLAKRLNEAIRSK